MTTPVASWTPPEASLMADLALRALAASLDEGPRERAVADADAARFTAAIRSEPDGLVLVLRFDADLATLALDPVRVDGSAWRQAWHLEIVATHGDTTTRSILVPSGPPITIASARTATVVAKLRVKRRALVRAGETVPLLDAAFHRHTRQSSAGERAGPICWAAPTTAEREPWWEIDLGKTLLLAEMRIELGCAPPSGRVKIVAFTTEAKGGGPARSSFTRTFEVADLSRTDAGSVVCIDELVLARGVRVSLATDDGSTTALHVLGTELLAGEPFAGSLRETMRRAFAVHGDQTLFEKRSRAEEAGHAEEADHYTPHLSYGSVWERAMSLAAGLAKRLELEPSTRDDGRVVLAIVLANRPEWIMADLAAIERGYVTVPLSPVDPDERLRLILERACPDAIVCEARDGARLLALGQTGALRLVVTVDGHADGCVPFEDVTADDAPPRAPRAESDLHSVLFTSGSTGTPKGAMRTYSMFHTMLQSYGASQSPRHLSFQPLSHLSERMLLPWLFVCGAVIAFSRGGTHLMQELHDFEPTSLGSVPRLFDLLYAGYKRRLRAALAAEPETPLASHEARLLSETRGAFGRRVESLAVGSAPVSREVLAFLRTCFADVWVTEGYGSTELGTITLDDRVATGVEVKLVPLADTPPPTTTTTTTAEATERGEIWVRTPHLISGYLGEEDGAAATLDADGFFPSGDLGERLADGTVRVVGRSRNTVKLAQGEFVSAERVESVLGTVPYVDRVYVHATSGAPGVSAWVHVAPDAAPVPADAQLNASLVSSRLGSLLTSLRAHGERAGLAAYELPRGILLADEAPSVENGLLTTSGKLARGAIAQRHGARLGELAGEAAPEALLSDDTVAGAHDDALDLSSRLVAIAGRIVGRRVDVRDPLGAADSLAAAEILAAVGDHVGREVPLAIWFESRTFGDLAARLLRFDQHGAPLASARITTADLARVPAFDATRTAPSAPSETPRSILVTGATGLLGGHLVEALVARTAMHVTCIVRGKDDGDAAARLTKALASLGIGPVPDRRLRVIAGDLALPRLGLDDARHAMLEAELDIILHAGAEVSWLASYEALRPANVLGSLALLELATMDRTKPMHFVSTISTAPVGGDEDSLLPFAAMQVPYAQSKWIAEEHVRRAGAAGLPVAIYRPAMIAAHTKRGVGNPDDFLHRYLVGIAQLGCYLDLEDARLDMTPADFVAEAIVALLVAKPLGGGTHHLANVDQSLSYAGVGRALNAAGLDVMPATYAEFRRALLDAPQSRLSSLASFFPASGFTMAMGPWPCERTVATLAALGVVRPRIDDAVIASVVGALRRRGALDVVGVAGHSRHTGV